MIAANLQIPTVAEIVAIGANEADELYAQQKHSTRLTEAGAIRKREELVRSCVEARVDSIRSEVLNRYKWSYDEIVESSEVQVSEMAVWKHPRLLLNLFEPDDVLWCGAVDETRTENFKRRDEWLSGPSAPAQFTCPSTFQLGTCSRRQENLLHRRYLVVESDTLDRDTVGGVFQWLIEDNGLKLHAVVDTAGKSLHGWFDAPPHMLADLKLVLPALGCDRHMFVPNQPCRMPGAARNGKFQRLIYLAQ